MFDIFLLLLVLFVLHYHMTHCGKCDYRKTRCDLCNYAKRNSLISKDVINEMKTGFGDGFKVIHPIGKDVDVERPEPPKGQGQ